MEMNLEQYKKDISKVMFSDECDTFNKLVVMLEISKHKIIQELLK